jgi:FixJ family two-component response regulator
MNTNGSTQPGGRVVHVIDSDAGLLHSLRFSLELDGYGVRTYPDGRELLASAELPASGCLVIDNDLPPATGLDVLAQLRRRGMTIPAILTASAATPAVRARASEAGVAAVVEKPLLGHTLSNAIVNALAGKTPAAPQRLRNHDAKIQAKRAS